ncbi:hypothetical protein SARC_01978 [Sphaeroforma arctica JP610]|uniref:SPX domain-containing protein n=1 Tax=Sphaeroforma arctica JP610 TaxID=667725 RepID=A0A0L0GAD6_9EUKA|nr:hypothetical protein SARC_01978 [Sphaeroforma arctica JP610]KNC85869.1 hypothetical protein SARC_01978 [Sphaeroforma arctica JP610]|eukprot:XP_014159771.1 hypothetical protein SARC_01978 [Sphaeroforma arctica JP610]
MEAAKDIQTSIKANNYHPQFRVSYNRMLFVDSQVHSVDMCLDSEMVMVKERGFQDGNWRRMDEDCKFPYTTLNTKQYSRFPFAVLQVNIHHYGDRPAPEWVNQITNNSLCIPVENFSKYLQGVSSLYGDKVQALPSWHMKLTTTGQLTTPDGSDGSDQRSGDTYDLETVYDAERRASVDFHKTGDRSYSVVPITDDASSAELIGEDDTHTALRREKSVRDRKRKNVMLLSRMMKSLARKIPNMNSTAPQPKKAKQKKPIAIPVRVEPKVIFANERTMLRWVNITMWLSTIGIGLIHQEGHKAWVSRVAGYLLVPVSVMLIVYSLYMFLWRDWKVRTRDPGPYNSFAGPVLITSVLGGALMVNYCMWFVANGFNPDDWVKPK